MHDYAKYMIKRIKSILTPDLLHEKYSKYYRYYKLHKTAGHCYHASEALYLFLGGKKQGYVPMVAKYGKETHWWIVDKNGKILDPTKEQYTVYGKKPPYHLGKKSGFPSLRLTKDGGQFTNCKRTIRVMKRVCTTIAIEGGVEGEYADILEWKRKHPTKVLK